MLVLTMPDLVGGVNTFFVRPRQGSSRPFVGHPGRPAVQRGMRPAIGIQRYPNTAHLVYFKSFHQVAQTHGLGFERVPQPLDDHVVPSTVLAVRGHLRGSGLDGPGEGRGGELSALVRVEDANGDGAGALPMAVLRCD